MEFSADVVTGPSWRVWRCCISDLMLNYTLQGGLKSFSGSSVSYLIPDAEKFEPLAAP